MKPVLHFSALVSLMTLSSGAWANAQAPLSSEEPASVAVTVATEATAEAWPEIAWVAETDNFMQVQFREAEERFVEQWGDLPQDRLAWRGTLSVGSTGASVAALRRRLGLVAGTNYDAELAQRVAQYRAAHGLRSGQSADQELLRSLNLGFSHYNAKVIASRKRAMQMPGRLGDRYVVVDAARHILHMYEGQQIVGTMKVVVGTADNQTPVLNSKFSHVVLNPYWNVPPDLVRDRYAARVIRGGKNYLTTRGFQPLSDWSENPRVLDHSEVDWQAVRRGDYLLRLRQLPGPGNGMGDIKFMFPNSYGVYLHDTPSKHLFGKKDRAASAGCVRVEKPWVLAQWLFGSRPQTSSTAPEQEVPLPTEVPIYITYLTARPNGVGFDFHEDGYNLDRTTLAQATTSVVPTF